MSRPMAEMLELDLTNYPIPSTESDLTNNSENDTGCSENDMAIFSVKTEECQKRRELKDINTHLHSIHERITHTLNEAGISPHLPEACLDDATILSFRPPDFCKTEPQETEKQKEVRKMCSLFIRNANTIKDLICKVAEWMDGTAAFLDDKMLREIDHIIARQEVQASESFCAVTSAMKETRNAILKLKKIGANMFDDLDDEDGDKSTAMNERTQACVNLRFRRQSSVIDAVHPKFRKDMLKKMVVMMDSFPEDIASLQADYDGTDEDEMTFLQDVSSEWRAICDDIRDTLISIHELKILKRSAKLRIRRILYMFKLIVAVLNLRDKFMHDTESNLLDTQTEVVSLQSKLNHVLGETKKWREKCTKTQTIVLRISKERDESRYEAEKLREDLGSCLNKISELNSLVHELKAENAKTSKLIKKNEDENFIAGDEKKRILELKDKVRKQECQLEELNELNESLKLERDDLKQQLQLANQREEEVVFLRNEHFTNIEAKLETALQNLEDMQDKCTLFESEIMEKEKEIKSLQTDLKAKEEVVKKLTDMAEEDVDEVPVSSSRRRRSYMHRRESGDSRLDKEAKRDGSPDFGPRQSLNAVIRKSSARLIPMPPRYKNDLTVTLDKALMIRIAKDVKNAYSFNSADNPSDPLSSLKTTNQWLDVAFKRLVKAHHSMITQMQLSQEALKMKADNAANQEIAHHLQVLNGKAKEMDKLKNQIEHLKNEIRRIQDENQKLTRQNSEKSEKLKAAMEEEQKIKELWKRREKELLEAGDTLSSHEKGRSSQKTELIIKDLKADVKRLKKEYMLCQQSLVKEKQARLMAEKAATMRRQSLKLILNDTESGPQQQNVAGNVDHEATGPSQAAKQVKTLQKLLTMGPTLQLSHLTDNMVTEIKQTVLKYKKEVINLLQSVILRYVLFRRYHDFQRKVRWVILSQKKNTDSSAIMPRMQALYWHLEAKLELINRNRESDKTGIAVSHCRSEVDSIFREVAKVILKLKEDPTFGSKEEQVFSESRKFSASSTGSILSRVSSEKPLIVPSNSILSLGNDATKTEMVKDMVDHEELGSKPENNMNGQVMWVSHDVTDDSDTIKTQETKIIQHFKQNEGENSASGSIQIQDTLNKKQDHIKENQSAMRQNEVNSQTQEVFSRRSSFFPEVSNEYKKNQQISVSLLTGTPSSSESKGLTWDRRDSILCERQPPEKGAKSVTGQFDNGHKSTANQTFSSGVEVPMTMLLDVHDVFHKARKHLQNKMRKFSLPEDRPLTSLSQLGSFVRSRCASITGGILPGVFESVGQPHAVHDQDEFIERHLLSSKSRQPGTRPSNQRIKKDENLFEIQALKASYSSLPKPKSATKCFVRRGSTKQIATGTSLPKKEKVKKSLEEKSETEMKERDKVPTLHVASRSISAITSSSFASNTDILTRRKSALDIVTLPSM